jgi:hypothetical protein
MEFSNAAEVGFAQWATDKGWSVTKNGYPDFLCRSAEGMALVEVKPDRYSNFSDAQRSALEFLLACQVPCYRWDPESGLERLSPESIRSRRRPQRTQRRCPWSRGRSKLDPAKGWRKCLWCDSSYEFWRSTAKYCSAICKLRANRAKGVVRG